MKHVKLFESFRGSMMKPLIIAKGDWSGILLDPTKDIREALFIHPSTFMVEYIANPTPADASMALDDEPYDLESALSEILGGDQNGSTLIQFNPLVFFVDPSVDPNELKRKLQQDIDLINNNPADYESSEAEDIVTDRKASYIYTPEFIEHCENVVKGGFRPASMMRKLVFTVR